MHIVAIASSVAAIIFLLLLIYCIHQLGKVSKQHRDNVQSLKIQIGNEITEGKIDLTDGTTERATEVVRVPDSDGIDGESSP